MAASKTAFASHIAAATSNAAAATTNGTAVNLTGADGATFTAQITNGATAPTVAASAILQVSDAGSTWYFYQQQSAGLTASATYPFSFDVPPSVMYARIQITGNTGQAVTCAAQAFVVNSL